MWNLRAKFSKILVSAKRTRIDAEAKRLNLQNDALDRELQARGFNLTALRAAHDRHYRSIDQVKTALETRGLDYTIESARELKPEHMKGVDLVISVGGDGTLLETAQFIQTSSTPLLGVNSDPLTSTGKLCAIALRNKYDFENYFNRIDRGNFAWYHRSRVGLSMISKDGKEDAIYKAALNEILFAEKDVCRPTMHQTKIDNEEFSGVQRSCGVLVCSGSGSTGWMNSASLLRQDDAELILDAAGVYDFKHVASRVVNVVNREFILPPNSSNVAFFIRELLCPPGTTDCPRRRGFASSVSVRSLGFDTHVFLDGLASIPVENGTTCVMKIHPDNSLRTFAF